MYMKTINHEKCEKMKPMPARDCGNFDQNFKNTSPASALVAVGISASIGKFVLLAKKPHIVRWHINDIKKYTKVFLISVVVIGLLQGISMLWMVHWFKKNLDERLTFSYVVLRKIALVQDEQDKVLKDLQNLQKKEIIIEQKK